MYYEVDENQYIKEVGFGSDKGYEISEERYIAICDSFRYCPADTDTHTHRLNIDVEWEAIPIGEVEPTVEELFDILIGGSE